MPQMTRRSLIAALLVLMTIAVGCRTEAPPQVAESTPATPTDAPTLEAAPSPSPSPSEIEEVNKWVTERPRWLGKRILPPGIDGFGEVQPTPQILRNRRFATIDLFPPPDSRKFVAKVGPVPSRVVDRSSWRSKCPVTLEQLAYIKMPFWGFDREIHMGELLTNASVAEELVAVFREMFKARFPIEEMRVVTLDEVQEWKTKPTGDTNVTSSFECREATQGSSWSQHAYGYAIDINPFHNPYLRGAAVAPELASAYLDRGWVRPGMILEGDPVVRAFDSIGWGWGGRWSSLKDWMHFSLSGS